MTPAPTPPFDIVKCYKERLAASKDTSMPVAAIQALVELISQSSADTMSEFTLSLEEASNTLKKSIPNCISLSAGCDLFLRFVTFTAHDTSSFQDCKKRLLSQGHAFVERALACRGKAALNGKTFIRDGATILIHSYSRVVIQLLLRAQRDNTRFSVYVTEARPDNLGRKAVASLVKAGIPATLIVDSAVGYVMSKVDCVLVGAEGVVENGGLINMVGTYQIAIVAKSLNVPFYAVAESYKFLRLFPLSQYDLPTHTSETLAFPPDSSLPTSAANVGVESTKSQDLSMSTGSLSDADGSDDGLMSAEDIAKQPPVDYTPPQYITLLFTDVGVVTPGGISDELIRLHS